MDQRKIRQSDTTTRVKRKRIAKPPAPENNVGNAFLPSLKFILLLLFITTCLAILQHIHTSDQFFPIKKVKVFGIKQVNPTETKFLILPLVQRGFFNVDVEQIRDRLSQMTWISEAHVKRLWPDQIRINIIEKQPIAFWQNKTLLSDQGELFSVYRNGDLALPTFYGPLGKQLEMINNFKEMNRLLAAIHVKIESLELTPYLTWKLKLVNGIKLKMGHKEILTRLAHFVKVYPKVIGNRTAEIEYVDLRYPNGMAVKWKQANAAS